MGTTHGTTGATPLDTLELAVGQAELARALRLVGCAVPARTALPALHHVLLDAAPGRLTLTARLLTEYASQLPSGRCG